MSAVNKVDLENLRDKFLEMQREKALIRTQVREEYRAKIKAEIESRSEIAERTFAVQLVRLRDQGAKRSELIDVIGDGTAATMRRYVELGGGTLAPRKTSEERKADRAADIGVKRVSETVFDWNVGLTADGDLYCPVTIQWKNGKPYAWPVDSSDVMRLRDDYGIESNELYEKGAEIVSAFGLTEN